MKNREIKLMITLTDHYDKMPPTELEGLLTDAIGEGLGWAMEDFQITTED